MYKMGSSQLVYKYFGFLVDEYKMQYFVQKLPDTIGVVNPTYIYSFYNQFGCFSLVEVAQRQEWDCYIAKKFEQNYSKLLTTRINQSEYIKRNIYTKRVFLKLTAKNILSQIKFTNSFWGILVESE